MLDLTSVMLLRILAKWGRGHPIQNSPFAAVHIRTALRARKFRLDYPFKKQQNHVYVYKYNFTLTKKMFVL